MTTRYRDRLVKNGFAFIPSHRGFESSMSVAQSIGDLIDIGNGSPIHKLTVKAKDEATPNTYSGIYGREEFPFHTDLAHWVLPPRFLMLRCIRGFDSVPTLLLDGLQLADQIGRGLVSRTLVKPRRPINGRLPLLRILRVGDKSNMLFRWDNLFLQPCGKTAIRGMEAIRKHIGATPPTKICLATTGDTLLIDNWRMLHSRSRIPRGCETRCIERAYLGAIH